MSTSTNDPRQHNRQHQLQRLLALIPSLASDGVPATVAQLAQAMAVSVPTVRRLLYTLLWSGQVERVPTAGRRAEFRRKAAAELQPKDVPPGNAPAGAAGHGAAAAPDPASETPSRPPGPPGPPEPSSSPEPPAPPPGSPPGTPAGMSAPRAAPMPADSRFDPRQLDRAVISMPLAQFLRGWAAAKAAGDSAMMRRVEGHTRIIDGRFSIIIDLNTGYGGGVGRARERVIDLLLLVEIASGTRVEHGSLLDICLPLALRGASDLYVVARLTPQQVYRLVKLDHAKTAGGEPAPASLRGIFRIWPDNIVQRQGTTALPTIKADAARNSFGCNGRDIVWAVVDSGIDGRHLHFATHRNLQDLPAGVEHVDLVSPDDPKPLGDLFGHGTHVAGIIAGELAATDQVKPIAVTHERDVSGTRQKVEQKVDTITGVAPQCKLVSYKVLDDNGVGSVSEIMAALEGILRVNGYGKTLRIHGVNMSLGYTYDPQWFACGHSPLCEVVDRLSRSGVCVVVAAGNSGFGYADTLLAGTWAQGMPMSINDPGNAEQAITVGSTHREAPHTYGVSYFSSKGPTGDGRCKPDLLAPGEKIISCLSSKTSAEAAPLADGQPADPAANARYVEDSGTSMAAPHVSGAIAALLSVRREFIGRADEVKRVLLDSALDLKRDRQMQGHGLIDLFSALQAI